MPLEQSQLQCDKEASHRTQSDPPSAIILTFLPVPCEKHRDFKKLIEFISKLDDDHQRYLKVDRYYARFRCHSGV